MRCVWGRIVAGLGVGLLAAAGGVGLSDARADGEAGLVIHYGDGRVETYCIGFTGESIDGAALLARAGRSPGATTNGLVCSIGDTGCSVENCLCECGSPGGGCTYWAYFTQEYGGGWRYSSLGYRVQFAGDGDVHGWQWGEGGPSNAPSPPAVSFDDICGHAPQGGAVPPTSTTAPVVTQAPPTTAPGGANATATEGGFTAVPDGDLTVSPSAVLDVTRAASSTAVVVGVGTSAPTDPGLEAQDARGDGNSGRIAFGVVAVVLVGAIGGAVAWRARGGGGVDT